MPERKKRKTDKEEEVNNERLYMNIKKEKRERRKERERDS